MTGSRQGQGRVNCAVTFGDDETSEYFLNAISVHSIAVQCCCCFFFFVFFVGFLIRLLPLIIVFIK